MEKSKFESIIKDEKFLIKFKKQILKLRINLQFPNISILLK